MPGISTSESEIEVVQVTPFGLWLAYGDEELYLDFDRFPWFEHAPVKKIFHVEEVRPGHFHWPDLDVDLDLDRMRNPERYPLCADPSKRSD